MDRYNKKYTRQLKGIPFDFRISDFGSKIPCLNILKNVKLGGQEWDDDYYAMLYDCVIESNQQTQDIICEYEHEHEHEYEDEDEDKDEDEDEDEDVHVDENNKDPEYCLFLENLTEHGKSYKLKISQDDEEPHFVYYEEQDNSNWCDDLQTCIDDSGDEVTVSEDMQTKRKHKRRLNEKSGRISTKKEVSKRKENNDQKSITELPRDQGMTLDPCYTMYMNGACSAVKCSAVKSIAVKCSEVTCKEEPVEYEKNVTEASVSDSDVVILDNVQNCSGVNNEQLVLAEKEPLLREKLMYILKHPYNEKEYEELSEYIEQERPVCRLRPLRNGRSRAFAKAGRNKSVLNYGPERFRQMLKAAKKDRPRALNLLRMFRFWLEHIPNDDAFQPWRDKYILKVRPSEKNAPTQQQQHK